MAIPDFLDYGSESAAGAGSSDAARTPTMPGSLAAGRCMVLFVASDGVPATLQTANGWVLAQDPTGTTASAAIAGQCAMAVYWKRAAGTSDTAPILSDPAADGNTAICWHITVYSNVRTSDTPFHKIATATVTSATTSIAPPSLTTTLNDCLFLSLAASANDDSTFNSWGGTGLATPNPTLDSGWNTSIGNDCSWAGGRGGKATAGTGSLTSSFGASTQQAQISLALASLAEPPSGVGDITAGPDIVSGAGAIELEGAGALTGGPDLVSGADEFSGSGAVTGGPDTITAAGEIELQGSAAITGGPDTATGTATNPSAMAVGNATVRQRENAIGPTSGTWTTSPIVTSPGSVVVAALMRGVWANAANPKSPTDSDGETWLPVGTDHAYAAFANSRAGVWYASNIQGDAAHTFSMTFGDNGAGGGDEVTLSAFVLEGVRDLIAESHVERTAAATITGVAVTGNGPAIYVSIVCGNGPVGQLHTFQPTSASQAAGWTVVTDATATGDPFPNGYIQVAVAVLIDDDGSLTNTAVNCTWENTTTAEGGHIFQAVFQMDEGVLGDAAITAGADTVSGEGQVPVDGSGALTAGPDTASGAGEIELQGTATLTGGSDTAAGAGEILLEGTGAVAGADAVTGAAETLLEGAGAVVGGDAVAGTGETGLEGTGTIAGSDSAGGTAEITLEGAVSLTGGPDTVFGEDSGAISGGGALAAGPDTAGGTGAITLEGLAALLGADALLSGAGFIGDVEEAEGQAALTSGPDALLGTGTTSTPPGPRAPCEGDGVYRDLPELAGIGDGVLDVPDPAISFLVERSTDKWPLTARADHDVHTAITRGLANYLLTLDGAIAGRFTRLESVVADWADFDTGQRPLPSASVYFDQGDLSTSSGHAPGRPRIVGYASTGRPITLTESAIFEADNLLVEVRCPDKELRAGVQKMLEDALWPVHWMSGFRLVLPCYHHAIATFLLTAATFADSETTAQQGLWPIRLRLRATCPVYRVHGLPLARPLASGSIS